MSRFSLYLSPKLRRGLAASAIVLCAGGAVLLHGQSKGNTSGGDTTTLSAADRLHASTFSGPGLEGRWAISHNQLAGDAQRLYAELTVRANASDEAVERAPLSMAVVMDTSGSMAGDKMEEAKQSVVQLLRSMRDDDKISLVRYDSTAELVQSLARVGDVRQTLISRVLAMSAGGGTNIPGGLQAALNALDGVNPGPRWGDEEIKGRRVHIDELGGDEQRVERVVLVSDGLDSSRSEAERLSASSSERGITISTLGIGLDFDESYLASVAESGRGNFAFVENANTLARFLERELKEAANTTIKNATARIELPKGVRLVNAVGADAKQIDGALELRLGSLFAGDERRIILELEPDLDDGERMELGGDLRWTHVETGETNRANWSPVAVTGTSDLDAAQASRDTAVLASATSALASLRQMAAADAYRRGDGAEAERIIGQNLKELRAVAAEAPAPVKAKMEEQANAYADTLGDFAAAAPGSDEGKAAAKKAVDKDAQNLAREAF